MRRIFTILVILCLFASLVDAQVTILWGGPSDPNSTFAGGINGWTTEGLFSSDPLKGDSAIWYWSSAASAAGGAYYGTIGPINSPSRTNGAMVFNSDRLDNNGTAGSPPPKIGKSPAPHSGVLISPVINCTGFNSVAVKFNQFYRNYQSTTFVDVTNDGGANWTSFQLNEEIVVNTATPSNSQKLIDISSVAANQAAVQFRFRFDGEYYFWIIDDVQLVKLPDYSLALNSHFYTPAAYRQPMSQICRDTFVFSANLNNKGGIDQTHVVFKGEILDIDRKTVLFADSTIIDRLAVTAKDTPFRTNNYFVPSSLGFGKYFMRWSVYSLDATGPDAIPADNIRIDSFEISVDNYAKAPRAISGVRAGSGAGYVFGNQYRTSDCWNANDQFVATEAVFQMVYNQGGTFDGYAVSVYLLRVTDDVDAQFSNFVDKDGIASASVEVKAADGYIGTSTDQNYMDIIVPLHDYNSPDPTNPPPPMLDRNSRYLVGIEHPPTPSNGVPVFQAISNEKDYSTQPLSTFIIDQNGDWFQTFSGGIYTPIVELNIALITKTDNKPLPANTMELYPNPVVDNNLRVKLTFDKVTEANITITDINGRVLSFEPHAATTTEVFNVNTSTFKAGNYLIRVSTEEGTSTKQFTVLR
jgi:hypothetical protein